MVIALSVARAYWPRPSGPRVREMRMFAATPIPKIPMRRTNVSMALLAREAVRFGSGPVITPMFSPRCGRLSRSDEEGASWPAP